MSVISAVKHWNGSTGVRSGSIDSESSEYTAVWKVITDNALDQADTILNYFRDTAGVPYLEDEYSYGNDSNPNSICKKIRPIRSKGSSFHWQVTFDYASDAEGGKQEAGTSGGGTSTNPLEWADQLNISHTTIQVPVYKAIHRGGIDAIDIGLERPVTNAAGDVLSPPLEKKVHIRVVRITRWQNEYSGLVANAWVGYVNNDHKQINKQFPRYIDLWQPQMAYIAEYGGASELVNGIPVWRNTLEIWVNPLGWLEEVLNRGFHAKNVAGGPDGRGGTWSEGDFLGGVPRKRRLVDKFNKPLVEPQLLGSDGDLLPEGADPVYIKWQIYGEKAFAQLQI